MLQTQKRYYLVEHATGLENKEFHLRLLWKTYLYRSDAQPSA